MELNINLLGEDSNKILEIMKTNFENGEHFIFFINNGQVGGYFLKQIDLSSPTLHRPNIHGKDMVTFEQFGTFFEYCSQLQQYHYLEQKGIRIIGDLTWNLETQKFEFHILQSILKNNQTKEWINLVDDGTKIYNLKRRLVEEPQKYSKNAQIVSISKRR